MPIRLIIVFFLFSVAPVRAEACATPFLADSLEFAGFSASLQKIFTAEKVQSILSKLPANCKIYGYDVGDYSGDDGMDVVLSTREENSRSRRVDIHFFVNAGAEFERVQSLRRRFIREAIEVGFSIERGAAYVTEKTGDYGWRITGYIVRDNIFRRMYQWTTDRMPYKGRETAVGYENSYDSRSHLSEEHFFGTNSNKSFLRQKYYNLPVFREGDDIPADVKRRICDSSALMIVRGGSSWHGPEDCSVFCSAVYDSTFVRFILEVHDDRLLYSRHRDSADYLALNFDFSRKTRLRPGGDAQIFSPNSQFGIYVIMGDSENRTPVVELQGKRHAEQYGHQIDVSVRSDPSSFQNYQFTITVPRALFENNGNPHSTGFVCSYHDVDYPANLSWVSLSASARGFQTDEPATYGRLHFVANARSRYEWDNLATHRIAAGLRRAGILP